MSRAPRSRRRLTWLVALLAALALVGAGCGSDDDSSSETPSASDGAETDAGSDEATGPNRGGELRVIRGIFHEGWDPDGALELGSIQYIQHVMEPLIRAAPDGQTLAPGLAESWEYDGEALTFTAALHPDATFSDGTPVTSADVAFSAEEWKAGPNYGILYASLGAAEIVDDQTIVFSLEYPDSSLEAVLTWQSAAIMPADFGGRSRDEYMADPIGAGPFVVESWTPGAELILARNENYHDPEKPYLDRIVITENSDLNQRMVAYEAGDADLILVPPDQLDSVGDDQLTLGPAHLMNYLGFNTTAPPFDDPMVRRAAALAVDYDALVALGNGTWEKGTGGIPPNIAGWAPPSEPYFSRDLEQARSLLADAGVDGLTVELTYDTGVLNHDLVAQVIQSSLAEAGIDVTIVALDTTSHLERTGSSEYDIDLWTMTAISPTAVDPIGYYSAVNYLYTGFSLDTINEVLVEFTGTTDAAAQQAAITKFQDEVASEVPFVGLTNQQTAFAAQPSVNGFAPAPWATWWYDEIWLSE